MGWHMRESSLAASQRAAITMVSRIALSHAQDGGRVHVLAARRAARMRSPVAPTEFYGKKSLNRRLV